MAKPSAPRSYVVLHVRFHRRSGSYHVSRSSFQPPPATTRVVVLCVWVCVLVYVEMYVLVLVNVSCVGVIFLYS